MIAADQIVRLVLVLLVLAVPVAAAWAIGRHRANRQPAGDRSRLQRRYLTAGAALSALLAMAWLSGLFTDTERQQQQLFFAGVLQGCLEDCAAGAGDATDACDAYCTCYRDSLRSFLSAEAVLDIDQRLSRDGDPAVLAASVVEDYRSEIRQASDQCRGELRPGDQHGE